MSTQSITAVISRRTEPMEATLALRLNCTSLNIIAMKTKDQETNLGVNLDRSCYISRQVCKIKNAYTFQRSCPRLRMFSDAISVGLCILIVISVTKTTIRGH